MTRVDFGVEQESPNEGTSSKGVCVYIYIYICVYAYMMMMKMMMMMMMTMNRHRPIGGNRQMRGLNYDESESSHGEGRVQDV